MLGNGTATRASLHRIGLPGSAIGKPFATLSKIITTQSSNKKASFDEI